MGGREKDTTTPPNFLFLIAVQNTNRAYGILCIGHLQYSAVDEYLSKESSVQAGVLMGRIPVNGSTVSLNTVLGWQGLSHRDVPYFHLEDGFHSNTCRKSFTQATGLTFSITKQ